jgi:hypothetical protein
MLQGTWPEFDNNISGTMQAGQISVQKFAARAGKALPGEQEAGPQAAAFGYAQLAHVGIF